jgi:hypothetical protein
MYQGRSDRYLLTDRTASILGLSMKPLQLGDQPYQVEVLHSREQETLILITSCTYNTLNFLIYFSFHRTPKLLCHWQG